MSGPFLHRLVLALLLAALVLAAGTAAAQDEAARTRKNFIPSETVGKRLLRVSELAEEERYAEAASLLQPLTQMQRLKNFDRAVVFQTYGLMLAAQEKYPEAIAAMETALAVDYLPDSAMQSLRFNLAQLSMAEENFPRAIELLEVWMAGEQKPNAQAEFLIAAAYAQTEQWDAALPHARRAVELDSRPHEQHLGVLLAVEFQTGNMIEALEVMKSLVTHFPRERYYMQLAAGYSNLGEDAKALAVLELADAQGWLDREPEIVQLAQRYLFADLPWPAARALERGLASGGVEATSENLELYANALLAAREYQRALEPMAKAAGLAENGNLYVRLAQIHLQTESWDSARQALAAAIEKGGLSQPGNAQLLLGIVSFNQDRFGAARAAFQKALADDAVAESARKWLEHVERAENAASAGGPTASAAPPDDRTGSATL